MRPDAEDDGNGGPSRREVVGAAGSLCLMGTAGCSAGVRSAAGDENSTPNDTPDGRFKACSADSLAWRTGGRSPGRSGRASVPGQSGRVDTSAPDGQTATVQPVVGGGSLYAVDGATCYAVPAPDGPAWRRQVDELAASDIVHNPALGCGGLYVPTGSGVVALDPATGDIRWRTASVVAAVRSDVRLGSAWYGEPTAWGASLVAEGALYVASQVGHGHTRRTGITALDARTGDERWTVTLPEGSYTTVSYGEGPIVAGGNAAEGKVAAISSAGGVEWERSLSKRVVAAPAVSDGAVYVVSQNGEASRLAVTDGTERWRTAEQPLGDEVAAELDWGAGGFPPSVRDGRVFVTNDEGMTVLDGEIGEQRWTMDGGVLAGQPVVGSERVLVADREAGLRALDIRTGEPVWTVDMQPRSGPVVADGRVRCVDGEGRVVTVRSSG
jgi:outer membrane protein assembly factor BamB